MGGCATKPKVLKADDRSIPAPPPESTKEAVAASDAKEGGDVVVEKGDQKAEADVAGEDVKNKDVVEADKVEDEANTRQSLGNLLNENEKKGVDETEIETKTVIEADNTPSEPTKTEPVEQESPEEEVPAEPIESTKEPEPLSVEPKAAAEATATATVDVTETEKKETSAAVAEGEEGKSEVAK